MILRFIIISVIIFLIISTPFREPVDYGSKLFNFLEFIVVATVSCVLGLFIAALWEVIKFV